VTQSPSTTHGVVPSSKRTSAMKLERTKLPVRTASSPVAIVCPLGPVLTERTSSRRVSMARRRAFMWCRCGALVSPNHALFVRFAQNEGAYWACHRT